MTLGARSVSTTADPMICPGHSSEVGHPICGTLGHMITNDNLE